MPRLTATCIVALIGIVGVSAHGADVIHYWDMDTVDGSGTPVDIIGGVATSSVETPVLSQMYGAAFTGAGNALNTALASGSYLSADVYDLGATAMNFGAGDFSFSYWSYDDFADDADIKGPRVFDSLATIMTGLQLGTNAAGEYNFRLDDHLGNYVVSDVEFPGVYQPQDQWTHVVVNVSRSTDTAEVFFNGASVSSYSLAALTGNVYPTQDLMIGAVNNASDPTGAQSCGLDDLAFYTGTLDAAEIAGLFDGSLTPDQIVGPPPEPTSTEVIHYWDMDTVDGSGVPQDLAGGLITTSYNPTLPGLTQQYGLPYPAAGNALITVRATAGIYADHLVADAYDEGSGAATALDFGTDDFSFSYWSYDDFAGDQDIRGARVMDSLSATLTNGIQLASNAYDLYNLRLDDDQGGSVISNNEITLIQPVDAWTHVVVNVSRSTDTVEIFFNGASAASYSIASLSGGILPSMDLHIGVINMGGNYMGAQNTGLDDLAYYSGLLSVPQIDGLADGSLTPLSISGAGWLGDMNCDGSVDLQDAGPFVLALVDPDGYAAQYPDCNAALADMNSDGLTNGDDVQNFIYTLVGFPPPVGACCLSGGGCVEASTEADCINVHGGVYVGDETSCESTCDNAAPVSISLVVYSPSNQVPNCPDSWPSAHIEGSGFVDGATVELRAVIGQEVVTLLPYDTIYVAQDWVEAYFDSAGAPPAVYELLLVNPDGGFAIGAETLEIVECP